MSRRACEERRTFSLRYGKNAMFLVRLRYAYTGFRLFNVLKQGTMPKEERSRHLPCNSAAANTIYGTILM